MNNHDKLSKEVICKIDKYVTKLARNTEIGTEDIEDFKNEMKSNLLSSIQELVNQGQSDKDAFDTAVKRFGEIKMLKGQINELYNIKSMIAKELLKITIFFGIMGLALFLAGLAWNNHLTKMPLNSILTLVKNNLGDLNNPITDDMKTKITSKVNRSFLVDYVTLEIYDSKIQNIKTDKKVNYDYFYAPKTGIDAKTGAITPRKVFFTYDCGVSRQLKIDGSDKLLNVQVGIKFVDTSLYRFAEILLIIYWVLFAIWSSINSIFNKRSIIWIPVFMVFNIFGYLMYNFMNKYFQPKAV